MLALPISCETLVDRAFATQSLLFFTWEMWLVINTGRAAQGVMMIALKPSGAHSCSGSSVEVSTGEMNKVGLE